jgi:phage terminase small subunit
MDPQHKLFADTYLIKRNATTAAIIAGYSKKGARVQGCKMLKYKEIAEYIAKHDQKTVAKHENKRDVIIEKLMIALEKGIVKDEEGEEHVNHKVLFPAAAELNRMLGYYAAEKHTNLNINADTDLQTVKNEVIKQQEILEKYRSEY